jgi:hypothetical protein
MFRSTAIIRLIFLLLTVGFIQSCKLVDSILKTDKSGIKLCYSFSDVGSLNYKQIQKIEQEIEVSGQVIKVNINQSADFNVFESFVKDGLTRLEVKLNSLVFIIDAGGQKASSDLKDLAGREFRFSISETGRETGLEEAEAIDFEIVQSEKANLTSIFKGFFPDVKMGIVNPGDTWNSSDTIIYRDSLRSSELILNNLHTLNGIVEMDGYNCAEIRNEFSGTIMAKANTRGMEIITEARLKGTSIWYFAFNKGIFIRESSSGNANGIIRTPQGEMKLLRRFSNEVNLVH